MNLVVSVVRESHVFVSLLISTLLDLEEHRSSLTLLLNLVQSCLLIPLQNLESGLHGSKMTGILNFQPLSGYQGIISSNAPIDLTEVVTIEGATDLRELFYALRISTIAVFSLPPASACLP